MILTILEYKQCLIPLIIACYLLITNLNMLYNSAFPVVTVECDAYSFGSVTLQVCITSTLFFSIPPSPDWAMGRQSLDKCYIYHYMKLDLQAVFELHGGLHPRCPMDGWCQETNLKNTASVLDQDGYVSEWSLSVLWRWFMILAKQSLGCYRFFYHLLKVSENSVVTCT